jgi:hypothetical protein
MNCVGIDPGLSGAVAIISPRGAKVYDTPVIQVGKKRELDVSAMALLLEPFRDEPCVVGLEWVHSMPKQGVASTFSFGAGFGMWRGIIAAMGLSCELIRPQAWQKVMLEGYAKGKGSSISKAKSLFPGLEIAKKHDGRADALLIASFVKMRGGYA